MRKRKLSVREMLMIVMLFAISFSAVEQVVFYRRSAMYLRKAATFERMERSCRDIRDIVAMDPNERRKAAIGAWDDPYLDDPEWTRKMITYFEGLKHKYRMAAKYPRLPVPRDPMNP